MSGIERLLNLFGDISGPLALVVSFFALWRSFRRDREARETLIRAALVENADNLRAWFSQRPFFRGAGAARVSSVQLRELLNRAPVSSSVGEFLQWPPGARLDADAAERRRGAPAYPAGDIYLECTPRYREQLNAAKLDGPEAMREAALRGIALPGTEGPIVLPPRKRGRRIRILP